MKPTRTVAIMLFLLAFVYLAGCGSPGGTGGRIEGTRWMLRSYFASGTMKTVQADTEVDALFEKGKVGGFSGVNTYQGTYKLSGSELIIGNLASTLMAGPQELMDLEQAYLADLGKTRSYTVDGQVLTLFDAGGKELLVFDKGTSKPLVGPTWIATSYYNGKDAVTSVLCGTSITAVFAKDGKLSGSDGVGQYTGTYETKGLQITISSPTPSVSTQTPDPAASQQQAEYLAALQLATRYEIKGDRLDLLREGGTIAATFLLKKN